MYAFLFSHESYMLPPLNISSSLFDHANNIWSSLEGVFAIAKNKPFIKTAPPDSVEKEI
jgi:hypothetical protein